MKEKGIFTKELQDRYEQGESWKYQTPYGEAYFSRRDVEGGKKYALNHQEGIPVSSLTMDHIHSISFST